MHACIIDAHNHPDWYGKNVDKFIQEMDELNIQKCWLLSWEAPYDEVDPDQFNVLSESKLHYVPKDSTLVKTLLILLNKVQEL